MKNLGVTEIISSENNNKLIIALAKTGNLSQETNVHQNLEETIEMNEDTYPKFEQQTLTEPWLLTKNPEKSTQVNPENIEQTFQILELSQARTFNIPPMIENHAPYIITMNKPNNIYFNTNAFKNYTDRPIPESVAIVLSFGPKFSIPIYYRETDFNNLKEAAYQINEAFSHPADIDSIREHISNHITEYKENQFIKHSSEVRDFFTAALSETKKFLKNNEDLTLTQADKANASIIMDKTTYILKVEQLLSDRTTYTPLRQSSNAAYQKINQKLLERMTKSKLMKTMEASEAVRTETNIANMYVLIKTHKKDNPPRPIVNTCGTPGYTLAKKVTNYLTLNGRDTTKYNVLNSQAAIKIIETTRILPDMKFHSYDAKSMFTNISVDKAIQALIKRKDTLKLSNDILSLIIDVIKFVCITNTEISFNNKIYKQTSGLRMGSSLSPILADFVMEDLLDKIFTQVQRPHLFIKYVDDVLTVVTDEIHEKIFKYLNEADNELKFENETENDQGIINYLDFTVINQPFNLKTKWFRKHISSGRLLNFHSHHLHTVIWHTAINYVCTMIKNSRTKFHDEIIMKARELLHINSYPTVYVEKVITTALEKIFTNDLDEQTTDSSQTQPTQQVAKPTYVTGLPFIPSLTQKIQKRIESSASQPRNEMNSNQDGSKIIKIASKPIHKLSSEAFNKHKRISSTQDSTTIDLSQE